MSCEFLVFFAIGISSLGMSIFTVRSPSKSYFFFCRKSKKNYVATNFRDCSLQFGCIFKIQRFLVLKMCSFVPEIAENSSFWRSLYLSVKPEVLDVPCSLDSERNF